MSDSSLLKFDHSLESGVLVQPHTCHSTSLQAIQVAMFRFDQQNEKLCGVKLYRNKQHLSLAVQFSEWPLCNLWKHSLFPPDSFFLVAQGTLFNSMFLNLIASATVKELNLPMNFNNNKWLILSINNTF